MRLCKRHVVAVVMETECYVLLLWAGEGLGCVRDACAVLYSSCIIMRREGIKAIPRVGAKKDCGWDRACVSTVLHRIVPVDWNSLLNIKVTP